MHYVYRKDHREKMMTLSNATLTVGLGDTILRQMRDRAAARGLGAEHYELEQSLRQKFDAAKDAVKALNDAADKLHKLHEEMSA